MMVVCTTMYYQEGQHEGNKVIQVHENVRMNTREQIQETNTQTNSLNITMMDLMLLHGAA